MAPPSDERPPAALNGALWRFSKARNQVAQDLIDGIIPMEGPIDSADIFTNLWAANPHFRNFPFDRERYDTRIASMRRQVQDAQDYAATDHAAIVKDRLVYPVKTTTSKGKPRWRGSYAERVLKMDIANNLHVGKKPKQLYNSRPTVYGAFDLKVFRGHLDQEREKLKPFDKRPGQCKNKPKLGDKELSRLQQP